MASITLSYDKFIKSARKAELEKQYAEQEYIRRDAAPTPQQLTYPEFHELAAAAVRAYCPKAKLVTDAIKGGFMAELSFGGQVKRMVGGLESEVNTKAFLENACREFAAQCGRSLLQ